MTDTRASDDASNERGQQRSAFSWPGRRRADEAAEAAERAALQGLERLRGKTSAEPLNAPARGPGKGDELRPLVFEATQQLRDAIKIEANEIGRLIQAQQESLQQVIESLQDLTSELRAAAPAETESVSQDEHLPPPKETPVDLNEASHADLCAIGMSETQASRVIRHRDFWGNFHFVSELDHVPGFPPEMRAELDQRLSVWRDDEKAIESD
jgi:DNA uptake protein ComE-like DNA-binding protein